MHDLGVPPFMDPPPYSCSCVFEMLIPTDICLMMFDIFLSGHCDAGTPMCASGFLQDMCRKMRLCADLRMRNRPVNTYLF